MLKVLRTALIVAALGSPLNAQDNSGLAIDFMVSCSKQLPATREMVQNLKSEGWRFEFSDGSFRFYSQNGRRVIGGTSANSSRTQGCLAAVSKLDAKGAIAVGAAVAKQLGLKRVEKIDDEDVLAGWTGKLNGHAVSMAAMPSSDFRFMRGASLVLIQE